MPNSITPARDTVTIVLSSLMLVGGMIVTIGVMNLPFLDTGELEGPARLIVSLFAISIFGIGGAMLSTAFKGHCRTSLITWALLIVGTLGFVAGFALNIYFYPSVQTFS